MHERISTQGGEISEEQKDFFQKNYVPGIYIHIVDNQPIYFRICLSRQQDNLKSDEFTGYVQNQFNSLALNPESDVIYLCGNPNMIDSAFLKLTNIGFKMASIRREKYISSN